MTSSWDRRSRTRLVFKHDFSVLGHQVESPRLTIYLPSSSLLEYSVDTAPTRLSNPDNIPTT